MNDTGSNEKNAAGTGAVKISSELRPPALYHVIAAVIAAGAAVLIPEFGVLSFVLISACAMFAVSGRAALPVYAIHICGLAFLWIRSGPSMALSAAVILAAALIAGLVLRNGGTFHDSLMIFAFITVSAFFAAVAVYTKINDISASEIYEEYSGIIRNMAESVLNAAGGNISLENAQTFISQYEDMMKDALAYAPAVAAWIAELSGIAALRLCGAMHSLSGSRCYPYEKRLALVSRPFAAVYIAALIVGALSGGAVGYIAGNIMLILLLPGAAGGISVLNMRSRRARLRGSGRTSFPFFAVLLILFFAAPPIPLIILSLTSCVYSFTSEIKKKSK